MTIDYERLYKQRAREQVRECLERTARFARPKPDAEPIVDVIEDFNDRCRREATEHQEACRREDRRRARAEEIIRKQHQQQQQPQQSSSNVASLDQLLELTAGVRAIGEASVAALNELGGEIRAMRERLAASEARAEQAERHQREMRTASAAREREMTVAVANLRSQVADLKVELKSAVIVGTVPATSMREVN
jgi:hypothetical protein